MPCAARRTTDRNRAACKKRRPTCHAPSRRSAAGLQVSEIGLGSWQLANPVWGCDDSAEALRVVQTALDLGCNFFDTAPGYGAGRSETLLGQALKPCRGQVVLYPKFGHPAQGPTDFSVVALRPSIEASLRRLQTDYLDVLLVHNPPTEGLDGRRSGLYEALDRLVAEGVLRSHGVSVDMLQDLRTVLHTTGSRVVELLFNVIQQDVRAGFDEALACGVSLVAKVPLDSGWLAGRYSGDSRFTGIRARWPVALIERRAALVTQFAALLPPGLPMAHGALRYILAHPTISCAIPGARSAQQVRHNIAAAEAALHAETVNAIQAFWQREIEPTPRPC